MSKVTPELEAARELLATRGTNGFVQNDWGVRAEQERREETE